MRFRTFTHTALLLVVGRGGARRAAATPARDHDHGDSQLSRLLSPADRARRRRSQGHAERATIGTEEGAITLVARELPREGKVEARGQFLDIGRMSQDDPRLIPFNLLDRIRAAYQDRWPKPGEELMLLLGGTAPPPGGDRRHRLRRCARWRWSPRRFDGQKVTITGQFRGRNLFGDLPEAPAQNRFQFVLRSSDAAVWVMGVQPKGRTFNFDPSKRIDTGRWVKVQGTVRTAKGLTWLEGTSIDLAPDAGRDDRGRDRSAAATAGRDPVHRAPRRRSPTCDRRSASACSCRAISIRRR